MDIVVLRRGTSIVTENGGGFYFSLHCLSCSRTLNACRSRELDSALGRHFVTRVGTDPRSFGRRRVMEAPEQDTAEELPRPQDKVIPRRVLVVDDNEDQTAILGQLLKLMGHEVRLASNGKEALEAAASFLPDIALVDIGLPGMNGYEVARRLRQDPRCPDMVLVAQTGWGQDENRMRSEEAGFDHHLVKPVPPHMLEEILQSLPKKGTAKRNR
jgi:CheY-like chemotaxis protein